MPSEEHGCHRATSFSNQVNHGDMACITNVDKINFIVLQTTRRIEVVNLIAISLRDDLIEKVFENGIQIGIGQKTVVYPCFPLPPFIVGIRHKEGIQFC